jgi:hypothetical protein
VLWRFATRARDAYSPPERYLRLPIHLRRMPGLPPDDVSAVQAAIIGEIAQAGRTVRELQARLALDETTLRRDIGALHLIGAITCDPARSLATGERRRWLHRVTDWSQPATAGTTDTSPAAPRRFQPADAKAPHRSANRHA